ncbi:hypothetical protein F5883DRAFT_642539 [Diaporthe sp. PMI_573]|nr:hypothetical protein F5883DRAFT_642539 [Diaporthaceae sp. PMI_573]
MMQAGISDAATAAGYASDASSYSVTASSLMDGIRNALSNLEGAAEALDGAMQAVNENLASFSSIELEELTEAGRVFSSYPEVSLAKGMLSNLSNIMKIAWANSPDVIKSLWSLCQAQWLPITSGGALITSVWVLHEVGNGAETEPRPEEERIHFILLEQGFPIPVFNVWTLTLDQNKGTKTASDASVNDDLRQRGLEPAYGPGYTTEITLPKATIIRALPFVRVVYLHPTFEQKRRWDIVSDAIEGRDESNDSQNRPFPRGFAATRKRELEESQAQMNLAAFSHYKGTTPDGTYTRDSSGGEGVTIFVPDTGAAIDGPHWQEEMHNPEWYVVSNKLTLPNVPEELRAPEDMWDWMAHGTDMACLAGGETFSLAPRSNLYLIKTLNVWLDETRVPFGGDPVWVPDRGTPESLHDAYFHIVQIVKDRRLQGRAVISNSNGYHYPRYINDRSTWEPFARGRSPPLAEEEMAEMMKELADFVQAANAIYDDISKAARSNGIIWIQSVGNQGAHPHGPEDPRIVPDVIAATGDTIPRFGSTSDSEMITVSAALEDGTLWPGLPENAERFAWSDARNQLVPWGVRMKQYMTALSYQWTDGIDGIIQQEYLGRLPFNLPSIVNMAYNGAHGPMNTCPMPPIKISDDSNMKLSHRPQQFRCHEFINDVWTEHRYISLVGCVNFQHRGANTVYISVPTHHPDLFVRADSQFLPPNNTHSIVYLDRRTQLRLSKQSHSSHDVDQHFDCYKRARIQFHDGISTVLPKQDRDTKKFDRGPVCRPRDDHGASVHNNRWLRMLSILPEVLHEPPRRWMRHLCGTNFLFAGAVGPAAQLKD